MSFKFQQVLRTKQALSGVGGETIPANTRVVVMDKATTDPQNVRVKVEDTDYPELRKVRVTARVEDFITLLRGRRVVEKPTA